MSKSLYQKVGIATLILMASVFLSRVIGLFREMAIAYAGGARADVDAYQIAFVIPEILNHIVASGFLSVTFIPVFSKYLAADRETEGWKVFSVIMNSFGLMLIVFITISMYFTPELISLTAPGIKDPLLLAKAVRMTRIILPAQFFFFTGGMFTAAQFAKESFGLPALAPLIYNIGIIAGGMLLGPFLSNGRLFLGCSGRLIYRQFCHSVLGSPKGRHEIHADPGLPSPGFSALYSPDPAADGGLDHVIFNGIFSEVFWLLFA